VRPMEVKIVGFEDAENVARLYLQSAEHLTEFVPDFYPVRVLDAVVAAIETPTR